MDDNKCCGCEHLKCIPMVSRGVMDGDPEEWYCELDLDSEEDEECPKYKEYVEYTKDDYDEDHWDERNGR